MSDRGRFLLVLGFLVLGAASAGAEDLERGKSGPAIFAADCAACHGSASGLAKGISSGQLMDLLRQHYTTGPGPAGLVAAYLLATANEPRRAKPKPEPAGTTEQAGKRRPGEGAGALVERPPEPVPDRGASRPSEPASKKRQETERAAEPSGTESRGRSKKPPQPATAARTTEPEPIQTPPQEPIGTAQSPRESSGAPPASASIGSQAAAVPPKPRFPHETPDQPAFSAPSP